MKHETQQVRPHSPSNGGSRRKYSVLAAVVGTLAIAALIVLMTWGPAWWDNRGLSEGTRSRPESDRKLDGWSSQEGGPSTVEGPAAKFQAELYGIVEPLVERLPHSPRARCLLASVHRRFARKEEAVRELQQCLALDPACAEAHYLLGIMALGVGDRPVAEQHLRDAFDIDPLWDDVSLRLAEVQISQSKVPAAVRTLDSYLKLEPKDAEAWCHLGQAYQKLGDHVNAKRCHLTAIEVNPDSIEAHYGAAKALQELGEADEAREYFEKFRRMRNSSTVSVRSQKAEMTDEDFMRTAIVDMATKAGAVYALHGYMAEAEKCWTRVTTLAPRHIECQEMLCRLRPDNPELWLSLGHRYIQGGRPREGEAPFRRVIELAPQRADGYVGLAQVYMLLGKNAEEAAELARTAVKLDSTAANYFVLAAACERLEDWSGAKSALKRAVELDPADPLYSKAYEKLKEEQRP